MKKLFLLLTILTAAFLMSGCYSVFNGGTGGIIVDAESTANPKAGIAYVNIYAYTDCGTRDSDFRNWKEGTTFSPSNSYYGHTTTDNNGNFSISNIVWKETKPDFGKDADYTTIYLLYYHENYGLTKDETVITSGSTSDTVYAELTAIRKTTTLNISINDVSTMNATTNDLLVTVSVPQSTDTITNAKPRVYEETITGNGSITISYPRWKNAEDKEAGIENTPEVSIHYEQNADTILWKACANQDNEAKNYAFLADDFSIKKTVKKSPYSISLFGKAIRMSVPTVNGTYDDGTGSDSNDGILINMKAKDSNGQWTIECGEATTEAQTTGTSSTQTHGHFSGLGTGIYWIDDTYTDKYATIDVKFFIGDTELTSTVNELKTNASNPYNVKLE